MQLPYHYDRAVGKAPVKFYVSDDPKVLAASFNQAASDCSTIADWLQTQPEVNPDKLGIAGISLGAIVTHLAMGRDAQIERRRGYRWRRRLERNRAALDARQTFFRRSQNH